MWFLQACCGLLFTIINHNHNQYVCEVHLVRHLIYKRFQTSHWQLENIQDKILKCHNTKSQRPIIPLPTVFERLSFIVTFKFVSNWRFSVNIIQRQYIQFTSISAYPVKKISQRQSKCYWERKRLIRKKLWHPIWLRLYYLYALLFEIHAHGYARFYGH